MTILRGLLISTLLLSPQLSANQITGSLTLDNETTTTPYKGITGDKDGFYRAFTPINGKDGLIALGRGEYYFTLMERNNQIIIDCIYIKERNVQNGAGIFAGLCNSNTALRNNYTDIAQDLSNTLTQSLYSFDTQPVVMGVRSRFFLGKTGKIEIYDEYGSANDLMNSSPTKYIKTSSGCLHMKGTETFLVFTAPQTTSPSHLEVVRSTDPMTTERLGEMDLARIATEKCDP